MENSSKTKKMNNQKKCPQCDSLFEGRSNQLYCSSLCKQRSFHASKVDGHQPIGTPSEQSSAASRGSVIGTDYKMEKIYETMRLESAERIKRLEIDERQQERQYELEREQQQREHDLEREQQKRDHELELKRQEFDRERERSKWEMEAARNKASQMESPQPQKTVQNEPTEKEPVDKDSGIGTSTLLLISAGISGLIWLANKTNKPSPKQIIPPNSQSTLGGLDDIADRLGVSKKQKTV